MVSPTWSAHVAPDGRIGRSIDGAATGAVALLRNRSASRTADQWRGECLSARPQRSAVRARRTQSDRHLVLVRVYPCALRRHEFVQLYGVVRRRALLAELLRV